MRAIPSLLVRTVQKCIPTVAVVRGYEMSYVAANPLPPPTKLGGRTASTNRRGILPSTAVLLYSCCVLLVLLLRVCCGRVLLGC